MQIQRLKNTIFNIENHIAGNLNDRWSNEDIPTFEGRRGRSIHGDVTQYEVSFVFSDGGNQAIFDYTSSTQTHHWIILALDKYNVLHRVIFNITSCYSNE